MKNVKSLWLSCKLFKNREIVSWFCRKSPQQIRKPAFFIVKKLSLFLVSIPQTTGLSPEKTVLIPVRS